MTSTEQNSDNCKSCGKLSLPGESYCSACNESNRSPESRDLKEPATVLKCSKCEAVIESGASSCRKCGLSLSRAGKSREMRQTLSWKAPLSSERSDDVGAAGQSAGAGAGGSDAAVPAANQDDSEILSSGKGVLKADAPAVEPAPSDHVESVAKKRISQDLPKKIAVTCFSALIGVLLGGAIWEFGMRAMLRPIQERHQWQSHSLVVYVATSGATVRVEEYLKRRAFAAQVSEKGSVVFDNLPTGDYSLFVEKPGYSGVFAVARVEDSRPAVFGFPEPLTLQRE